MVLFNQIFLKICNYCMISMICFAFLLQLNCFSSLNCFLKKKNYLSINHPIELDESDGTFQIWRNHILSLLISYPKKLPARFSFLSKIATETFRNFPLKFDLIPSSEKCWPRNDSFGIQSSPSVVRNGRHTAGKCYGRKV